MKKEENTTSSSTSSSVNNSTSPAESLQSIISQAPSFDAIPTRTSSSTTNITSVGQNEIAPSINMSSSNTNQVVPYFSEYAINSSPLEEITAKSSGVQSSELDTIKPSSQESTEKRGQIVEIDYSDQIIHPEDIEQVLPQDYVEQIIPKLNESAPVVEERRIILSPEEQAFKDFLLSDAKVQEYIKNMTNNPKEKQRINDLIEQRAAELRVQFDKKESFSFSDVYNKIINFFKNLGSSNSSSSDSADYVGPNGQTQYQYWKWVIEYDPKSREIYKNDKTAQSMLEPLKNMTELHTDPVTPEIKRFVQYYTKLLIAKTKK
jgi:hypothetical protein